MGDAHRHPFGQRLRGVIVGHVTTHEHKALRVDVGDDVARSSHCPQPGRDRLEQVRAGGVAKPFLHVGQVVELDRDDGAPAEMEVLLGEPHAQAVEVEHGDAGLLRAAIPGGRRASAGELGDRRRVGTVRGRAFGEAPFGDAPFGTR